jgi:signal transduction histidine kinase
MSHANDTPLIEARALIAHLQAIGESHKAALARTIHNDIASLMVAALMDLYVLSTCSPEEFAQQIPMRLKRAQGALQAAVDRSRRIVEDLRPSILDNFGLFSALQWRVEMARRQTDAVITEWYSAQEPTLSSSAATALFRIAEEAIGMTLHRGQVTLAALDVRIERNMLQLELSDNGVPQWINGEEPGVTLTLASMRHRLELLGGTVELERALSGQTVLRARLPLS